jgi:hypothetical protein
MGKNRGSASKKESSYLMFFALSGGTGFSVKTKTGAASSSRNALLTIHKKIDNSGA